MKASFSTIAALTATFAISVLADAPTCGGGSKCPSDSPCCSQYGACGTGAYCLGGCDPVNSFDLKSCVPAPVCKSADYKLSSLKDVMPNTQYLGDPSSVNWVSSGIPAPYNNNLMLTMAPSTVGTLLSSTHYVWYGKITAKMTTSQGQGVVTAFILMSDVKDEIDFEFVGVDTHTAQSNFYFQGITDYNNGKGLSGISDTAQNFHEYTIDWQPDQLTWAIDGNVLRTLKRSDTYNTTTQSYHYPQTPARVQLSLWPAGLASNGEGTIEWAGGLVNWDSQYMQNGYYFAQVQEVNVECYDPPQGFSKNKGSVSYTYDSPYGTNDTVVIGNNPTVLSSFYASGDNLSYDPNAKTGSSQTNTSALPETVPGVSGGGARSEDGSTSSSGQAGGGDTSGSSGTDGNTIYGSGNGQFSQGTPAAGTNAAPKVMAGSAVALLGFIVAALLL